MNSSSQVNSACGRYHSTRLQGPQVGLAGHCLVEPFDPRVGLAGSGQLASLMKSMGASGCSEGMSPEGKLGELPDARVLALVD